MDHINNCLLIVVFLMVFYLILMIYVKYFYKKQKTEKFTSIPNFEYKQFQEINNLEDNIYKTQDTRIQFSNLPPVNPIARNTTIQKTQEANSDLYTSQPFDVNYSLLDNPPNPSTNELLYSGGETNMINIPLQMNSPNEEQLRTQKILITPYNKIKYGNC